MVNDILTEQWRTILLLYIIPYVLVYIHVYYIDMSIVKPVLRGCLWDKKKVTL